VTTDTFTDFEKMIENFEKHLTKKENGCWKYGEANNRKGYCFMAINKGTKTLVTSRASWEIHFGNIPPMMCVCHKCDRPSCCNPDHLFLGTHKENMKDMLSKGRASWQKKRKLKELSK
jgi:hypothetical protein